MARVIRAKLNTFFIVRMLLIAIFLVSVFYIYLLTITVQTTIKNKQGLSDFKSLNQQYQALESKYFNFLSSIDLDYAHQIGFVDQSQKADYVIRQASVARR